MRDAVSTLAQRVLDSTHGLPKGRFFDHRVLGLTVGDQLEVGERGWEHDGANGDPGRCRQSLYQTGRNGGSRPCQRKRATSGDIVQSARQLGADGYEEGNLILVEYSPLPLLHYQHAQCPTEMHKRHAQKPTIPLFAGFGEVAVVWVISRVFEVDRLLTRGHQSNDPLVSGEADLAHRLGIQSF